MSTPGKNIPDGMMEKTVKSAKPLYAAAAVFLLCSLLFRTYSLLGLVGALLVTAGVYLMADKAFGSHTILVEAPGTIYATGEKSLDEVLTKAEADLKSLHALNGRIADEGLSDAISRMEKAGRAILAQVAKEPAKAKSIRKFAAYYLPTAIKVLTTYADLSATGAQGENARALQADVKKNADTIAHAFEAQLDALFAGEVLDVSSDLDVLQAMAKGDGLSARELRATAAPAAPAAGNLDATARQSLAGVAADLAPGKTDEDELKPHLTL